MICLTIFWKNLKWDYFIYSSNTTFENINYIINIFVFYSIFSIFLKNINFLLFSIHKSYLVDLIDILSKLIFFIILLLLYLNNVNVELFSLIKIQIFSFLTVLIISNILFFKISPIKIRFKLFKFSNLLKILKKWNKFFYSSNF